MKDEEEIAILAVFIIFVLPLLIKMAFWSFTMNSNSPEKNIEKATELITDAAIPWWLGIFEWLAGLPRIIGAGLIIVLIYFLKWIGEIK
ncbi:MAG: hypothetical protein PWQ87_95 [Candidatus Woesearchaeota archaeon]|nr:hypothetical protein [Candidatus Woesearchaeota archaeon]